MQWFRSIHGAPTHRKWLAVSRKSGQPVPVVVSVVWALMDYASRQAERGDISGFDSEDLDAYLGVDDGVTDAVIAALTDKEWLIDGRIASWDDHQTKREDGAAERAKAWRERKRTQANADDTEPNAPDTDTDSEKITTPNGVDVAAAGDDAPDEVKPNGSGKPDQMPVQKAFRNWNTVADRLGLPRAEKLTDARRRGIAARLREFGIDGWNEALANLEGSAFCRGENDRHWRADLDFVIQPKSFTRLKEGAYADTE